MSIFIRIALRYGAAILVTRGLLGSDDAAAISSDPDIQMAVEAGIGFAIAGATEAWHWAAQKFNWSH
ncbi:hypothetical protein EN788_22135 [Mesorhizobium sp. M2D.F.Ca.ET.145.01.1.1]|uniref:hypothetical protein n=1 Tax=unclassified Mesorhizobium TaxID=325217 RepID=UPI000FCC49DC|nr:MULTISPECIES: hypothetical protein [unclassified Mesorhizobium]TGU44618.1 hypothetical protein EN789_21685 [bacterium M00.F.Ca.ET.146.01.1.1]TGU58446.1 hypothetical protein EN791_021685 [Mesorhizobium sp. M2D.F.Ca.ET.148.01.1.1]TGU64378.1 hypothetical protein EN790_21680 [Mesorhizobium sp. M2D.F.Ca.ET.147.01.1.1]TGW09954.1 hypothetical protein EN788_22135 [Mesorhizobium sp. M2D.F.Ca.ET.145.01.1.1]